MSSNCSSGFSGKLKLKLKFKFLRFWIRWWQARWCNIWRRRASDFNVCGSSATWKRESAGQFLCALSILIV